MTPILFATLAGLALTQPPALTPGMQKEQPATPPKDKAPASTLPVPHGDDWPFTADMPTEVAKGYQFTEGPTWVPGLDKAPGVFVFCDMRGNKVYRYDGKEKPEAVRAESGRAVGSIADDKGVVYQVETGGRRIIKWSIKEGVATDPAEVASKFEAGPLGGMNDLTLRKADGTLYVSHGSWFLPRGEKTPFSGVLRIATDGTASKAADGLEGPNGICFSPDGKTLYVNEYGAGRVNAFPVKDDGSLGEKKVFADLNAMATERGIGGRGGADGCHTDVNGNLFTTGPKGIWVLSPEGKFIAHLPFQGTNIAFGGDDMKTLLITTGSGVSKIGVKVAGTR